MAKWLKSTNTISFDVDKRIARIRLNRPEKRNAMSVEMLTELSGALMEADDRKDVSVIVLTGEGRDFCSGYDLMGYHGAAAAEASEVEYRVQKSGIDDDAWTMERSQDMIGVIRKMHKFVIAGIHGYCLAGGTDLALSCDMVIAASDAKIGFPAARGNGTPPTNWWMYHCGPQWAKRMLATGDMLWGRDAAKIGLVMDSVDPKQLDDAVMSLAKRISHVDTDLLAAHKRVVDLSLELMGGQTLQRLAVELDARTHQSFGPMRAAFKKNVAEGGLKAALKERDRPFGDGMVRLGEPQQTLD